MIPPSSMIQLLYNSHITTRLLSQYKPTNAEDSTHLQGQNKLVDISYHTPLFMGLFIPYHIDAVVARPSRSCTLSRTAVGERIGSPAKTLNTNVRPGVLPLATSIVKPSDVFKATEKQQKRFVANKSSFWAKFEETIIDMILPGANPAVASDKPKPSVVLGWLVPRRRSTVLQPSHVLCSCELLQKCQSRVVKIGPKHVTAPKKTTCVPLESAGRFASLLVNIASQFKATTPRNKDLDTLDMVGRFASLLVNIALSIATQSKVQVVLQPKITTKPKGVTKTKVTAPVKKSVPTPDKERVLVQGAFKPEDKIQPLRILLLRRRAFHLGIPMPMPSRAIPVPVPQVVVEVADDSNSDSDSDSDADDEEQERRNAFEGWNEYD